MKRETFLVVLCFLLCFAACKKNNDEQVDNDDPPISGENIPFESVQSLFAEIETQITGDFQSGNSISLILSNTGKLLENNSLVSDVSNYSAYGIKSITFKLTNGMIVNIPFIGENLKGKVPSTAKETLNKTNPAPAALEINQGKRQSLTQVLPEQNPPSAVFASLSHWTQGEGEKDLGPELNALARKHGWNSDYGTYGMIDKFGNQYMGVDFFKTLNEYSLAYISSHGLWSDTIAQDKSWFLIMTDDLCNLEMHELFWDNGDFIDQRIGVTSPWLYSGHADVPDFIEHLGEYYAITHNFIDHYCGNFPNNSVVVLDMCMGMSMDCPLVSVLADKNAGEIIGWSGRVHWAAAVGAEKYLFTRLFGEIPYNMSGCLKVGNKNYFCTPIIEPPIRPFGFIETFEGLREKGWDRDIQFGDSQSANLFYYPVQGGQDSKNINLIPSIYGMYYDVDLVENEKLLTIHGNFGEKQGKVTLDGKEVSCTWEHDKIVADLGGTEGGGPVVVDVNGLKSNPHPLTAWEGTLKVEGELGVNEPSIEECEVSFQFRTEIVDERPDPEADPKPEFGENGGIFEGESKVTVSLTGSYTMYDCIYNFDIPHNKNKVINVGIDADQTYTGLVYIKGSKANFTVAIAYKGYVEKTCPPDPPEIEEHWVAIPLIFETGIDEYGKIAANTITSGNLIINIEQDIKPDTPPTDETQR